jgi:hypothetical protein
VHVLGTMYVAAFGLPASSFSALEVTGNPETLFTGGLTSTSSVQNTGDAVASAGGSGVRASRAAKRSPTVAATLDPEHAQRTRRMPFKAPVVTNIGERAASAKASSKRVQIVVPPAATANGADESPVSGNRFSADLGDSKKGVSALAAAAKLWAREGQSTSSAVDKVTSAQSPRVCEPDFSALGVSTPSDGLFQPDAASVRLVSEKSIKPAGSDFAGHGVGSLSSSSGQTSAEHSVNTESGAGAFASVSWIAVAAADSIMQRMASLNAQVHN